MVQGTEGVGGATEGGEGRCVGESLMLGMFECEVSRSAA